MQITPDVLAALEAKEGHPHRYTDVRIKVHISGVEKPVKAITFVVNPDCRLEHDVQVTQRYRDLILAGAQEAGFSAEYQEQLHRILRPLLVAANPAVYDAPTHLRRETPPCAT